MGKPDKQCVGGSDPSPATIWELKNPLSGKYFEKIFPFNLKIFFLFKKNDNLHLIIKLDWLILKDIIGEVMNKETVSNHLIFTLLFGNNLNHPKSRSGKSVLPRDISYPVTLPE